MDETTLASSADVANHVRAFNLSPQTCDQLFIELVGRLSQDAAIRKLAAWGSAELS